MDGPYSGNLRIWEGWKSAAAHDVPLPLHALSLPGPHSPAAFAERLKLESGDDANKIIQRAYQLALGRVPTKQERALATEFLKDQPLKEFRAGIDEGFTATAAKSVTIDNRKLVQLALKNQEIRQQEPKK